MLLKDKYFKIRSVSRENELNAVFHCELLADCDVYRGHFPEKPVSPGVCNIEMIKECAMELIGSKLLIKTIKQCRLTAVAAPQICPEVDVTLAMTPTEEGFSVIAKIADTDKSYMEYKGEMKV